MLRHGVFIDTFLQALHHASYHVFLRDCSALDGYLRPLSSRPYLHHSALVYADVVALHRKTPHYASQLVKTIECLVVEVQGVREGDVSEVAKSDGYLLQEEGPLVSGNAEFLFPWLFLLEIESSHPPRVVPADE